MTASEVWKNKYTDSIFYACCTKGHRCQPGASRRRTTGIAYNVKAILKKFCEKATVVIDTSAAFLLYLTIC